MDSTTIGAKSNSKMEFKIPLYSDLLFVTVGRWKTSIRVGLRYFCKYESSSSLYPTKQGLNLYMSQWNILRTNLKELEKEMKNRECKGPLDLGMDVTASIVLVNHWLPVLRIVHSAVADPIDLAIEDVKCLSMDDVQAKIEDEIQRLKEECEANKVPLPRPNTLVVVEEKATPTKLFELIGVSPLECELFLKTISLITYVDIERGFFQDKEKNHCVVKNWNENDNWDMVLGWYFMETVSSISQKRHFIETVYERACDLEEIQFIRSSVDRMYTYMRIELTSKIEFSIIDCIRKYMMNIVPIIEQNEELYEFIEFINPIIES